MPDIDVRSLEYLKGLARLHSKWKTDSACQCCDWAAEEIERLRTAIATARAKLAIIATSLTGWEDEEGMPMDFGIGDVWRLLQEATPARTVMKEKK